MQPVHYKYFIKRALRHWAVAGAGLLASLILLLSGCGEPPTLLVGANGAVQASTTAAPVAPIGTWLDEDPYLRGYPALAEAVAALGNNIRVLHTGAHPDDERSDLMAYLARGRHFRTAYLAANRGEGGQNGIGPEKGMALGVVRTEEMLAARRIDGAEQYFLSKADFGFSKTADETFKQWGHDETLKELVTFIRWYRPHVIISAFTGTSFDGHGHHQAMGILTREAFDQAADPAYDTGQPAWTTQLLFNSLYNDPGVDQVPGQRFLVDTGVYDPLLGKTYHQMAMAGRSEHRSQDMGQPQDPGAYHVPLRLWAMAPGVTPPQAGEDPFASIEAADSTRNPAKETALAAQAWDDMRAATASARQAFVHGDHDGLMRAMSTGHAAALRGRARVEGYLAMVSRLVAPYDPLIEAIGDFSESAGRFERALYLATGVVFDVRCDRQFLTPGESATLTVRFIGRADAGVNAPEVSFDHAEAWHILATGHTEPASSTSPGTPPLPPGPDNTQEWTWTFSLTVPVDAPFTQPQYLLMAWADMAAYGNHHQATMDLPPIVAHLTYRVAQPSAPAAQLKISTSAQYVWTDPRFGERREMVKVVPPVVAKISPQLVVTPTQVQKQKEPPVATLTLFNLCTQPLECPFVGRLVGEEVHGPFEWLAPTVPPQGIDAGVTVPLHIQWKLPSAGESPVSRWRVNLRAFPAGTKPIDEAAVRPHDAPPVLQLTRIDYPHIRPHNLYAPAECIGLALNAWLPADLNVAYISGPGTDDEMIGALRQLGATVTVLDEDGLAKADFKAFDTVFAGVRAYEVRPDLVAHNDKLMDWVKAGGTLIVLYEKYPFAKLGCAPAKFQYSEPHDRVTEEDASVTILKPDHHLLTAPNKITEKDFEGWHQDRGLYFFAEDNRDPGYTALLSCHDTNEPPKTGGLLDYNLGQGHWVYCAYALHLQIPEAVPGAWRILANLAAYGRTAK